MPLCELESLGRADRRYMKSLPRREPLRGK